MTAAKGAARSDPTSSEGPLPEGKPAPGGLLAELQWRGMFHDATPGLAARLATGRSIAGYNGFDPSAPWLHIGHLVPIFGLVHLQRHGGRPVALVGGGTGMIGDPSGRSTERNLLDRPTIEANTASIRVQLERFLDFAGPQGAVVVDNYDWLSQVGMLDFLRDVGKHFTVPYMLAKDSVQVRLDRGLSYTEFSYMLLQAADFLHLHKAMGVELQMGGADQWGNITAGLELIRRVEEGSAGREPAHGLSYPLLLAPSGTKFGKSEAGDSIWLDAARTSPYEFYQYWLNADDRDVGVYLRWFTLFDQAQVEALEVEQTARPEERPAQRALAHDLSARVHGRELAGMVRDVSEAVFSRTLPAMDAQALEFAATQLPSVRVSREAAAGAALEFAMATGAFASVGEARRVMKQGGLYLNEQRVTEPGAPVPDPVAGRFVVIRTGKRTYRLAVVEKD